MRKFYCEHTGSIVQIDDSVRLHDSLRVFGSRLDEIRHIELEKDNCCRLANVSCFDFSSFTVSSKTDFVWCKNDFSLQPKRYKVVVSPSKGSKEGMVSGCYPIYLVDSCVSDEAIVIISEYDRRGDPFENASLVEAAIKCGKTLVTKGYAPLTETDVAKLLDINQSAVHAIRQLNYASRAVKDAYYLGLDISRVIKICRLPEEEQAGFVTIAKQVSVEKLNRMVSDKMDDLGIIHGRAGFERHRGNRQIGRPKVRDIDALIAEESRLLFEYKKRIDAKIIDVDTFVLRGILQGLRYAMSLTDKPEVVFNTDALK